MVVWQQVWPHMHDSPSCAAGGEQTSKLSSDEWNTACCLVKSLPQKLWVRFYYQMLFCDTQWLSKIIYWLLFIFQLDSLKRKMSFRTACDVTHQWRLLWWAQRRRAPPAPEIVSKRTGPSESPLWRCGTRCPALYPSEWQTPSLNLERESPGRCQSGPVCGEKHEKYRHR